MFNRTHSNTRTEMLSLGTRLLSAVRGVKFILVERLGLVRASIIRSGGVTTIQGFLRYYRERRCGRGLISCMSATQGCPLTGVPL